MRSQTAIAIVFARNQMCFKHTLKLSSLMGGHGVTLDTYIWIWIFKKYLPGLWWLSNELPYCLDLELWP